MKYQHPEHGQVTILAIYSSHVNVQTSTGIKPVQLSDLTPVEDEPLAVLPPTVETPSVGETVATVETQPLVESVVADDATTEEVVVEDEAIASDEKPEPNADLVNLNTATVTQLNRKLPFIGNKRAKLIIANRPEGTGYRTHEQFRELNPSLLEDELAWSKLLALVTV
jgi:DNA uptake protein ComE-like DNA-binding protein